MVTTTDRYELSPEELVSDYRAYKLRKAENSREPAVSNRCSELGHPCTAYAYFSRTVPADERPSVSEDLAEIFDEGKKQERSIQADLLEMHYDVKRQQERLYWPKYNITGHKDFAISKNGSPYVRCEFKSVNPYTFDKLSTPEDVRNNKATWVQKWYSQTILYMLLDNQKEYWLFLKNKSRGSIKPIRFVWNDQLWEDAEALLKKAETVNRLVQIGEKPTQDMKIANADECSRCQFFTVCLPEMNFGVAARILSDELADELAEKTERLLVLKPFAKEYEDLDEEVKADIKGVVGDGSQVVYGDYIANVKRVQMKAQPEKVTPAKPASVQVRITFQKTGGVDGSNGEVPNP